MLLNIQVWWVLIVLNVEVLSWKKKMYSHMTVFQMLVFLWNFDILSVFTHRSYPLHFSVLLVIFCRVTVPLYVLGKSALIRNYKLYAHYCDAHICLSTHTKMVILILKYTILKLPVTENVLWSFLLVLLINFVVKG